MPKWPKSRTCYIVILSSGIPQWLVSLEKGGEIKWAGRYQPLPSSLHFHRRWRFCKDRRQNYQGKSGGVLLHSTRLKSCCLDRKQQAANFDLACLGEWSLDLFARWRNRLILEVKGFERAGSAERRGGKAMDTSSQSSWWVWPLGIRDLQRSSEVEREYEISCNWIDKPNGVLQVGG